MAPKILENGKEICSQKIFLPTTFQPHPLTCFFQERRVVPENKLAVWFKPYVREKEIPGVGGAGWEERRMEGGRGGEGRA